jgi:hypothetical protein
MSVQRGKRSAELLGVLTHVVFAQELFNLFVGHESKYLEKAFDSCVWLTDKILSK